MRIFISPESIHRIHNSVDVTHAPGVERSDIPEKYTWNLEDIYPDDLAFEKAKKKFLDRLPQITIHQKSLTASAKGLVACLAFISELSQELEKLGSYAHMKFDQDTRQGPYLAMKQEVEQIGTDFQSLISFVEPAILTLSQKQLFDYLDEEPSLRVYSFYLNDLHRRKKHYLSKKEEKILAEAELMANNPYDIFSVFSNAELPYPEVKLGDGAIARLNPAGYSRYRSAANRADRENVFQAFFGALKSFQNTFGVQLYGLVKSHLFFARTRGYLSTLESALDRNNVPLAVYRALLDQVNENLPTFHRYLRLKKRMLGVDTLKYSDMYAPVVPDVERNYNIEQAHEMVLRALAPLGSMYVEIVQTALQYRWIDLFPNRGKRSGAYSNGSLYDVHPYILMNFNGQFSDVSTLAHELGHTMHSHLSNQNQPYPLANYPIFVAEVASTFNEALLVYEQLRNISSRETRLTLLMNHLDNIKGTVFRQTQFAEFEWRIHQQVENGNTLTGENLTQLYGEIAKKYYGHDSGVCLIDDLYAIEWAYIPHFYYNFYVYQYATAFTASTALSFQVLKGEQGAVERYLAFLKSGGSDYPIELLKAAGVDLTRPEPFQQTMTAMNQTMDEIEALLR